MASVSELLSTFETTEDLAEAEAALDRLAAMDLAPGFELGERYDGLAEAAAESDDFALAVRAQRRALEHGCRHPELGREMLGWYLLKAGEWEEGEAHFAALREERPRDPHLLATLAAARGDSGDHQGALDAVEKALEIAKEIGEERLVEQLRSERFEARRELGLSPDEEDRLAPSPAYPDVDRYAVAWCPRDQLEEAIGRWSHLAEELGDPDAYCGIVESRLREVRDATGRAPSVAPLDVRRFVEYAEEKGLDPSTGRARSRFAAHLGNRGETIAWPPGRNDPCWCGSGRKYKRCCAS